MSGNLQGYHPLQDILNFLSINFERWDTTQYIPLARAYDIRIYVLLVQEAWCSSRTKTHSNHDLHLSFTRDDNHPRTATYIEKDPKKNTSVKKYPDSPTGD